MKLWRVHFGTKWRGFGYVDVPAGDAMAARVKARPLIPPYLDKTGQSHKQPITKVEPIGYTKGR